MQHPAAGMTARRSQGKPLLSVESISTAYGQGSPVFADVSFELDQGERLAVLGPNGGGKTTLFKLLLGELSPLGGRISASGAFVIRPADRALATRLSGECHRRRADGDAFTTALVAPSGPPGP